RSEQILAITIATQIDAATLLDLPLRRFHELHLLRHVVTESGRWTAVIQTNSHEDASGHCFPKSWFSFVPRDCFVDAAPIVGLLAEVFRLGGDLFCLCHNRVFVAIN